MHGTNQAGICRDSECTCTNMCRTVSGQLVRIGQAQCKGGVVVVVVVVVVMRWDASANIHANPGSPTG